MKIVVIGAGQGLGLVLVKECARRGHPVMAGLRRPDVPGEITTLEQADPDRVFHVQCDVTDEAQVKQAAAYAKAKLGEIDAVINSSGILLDDDRKALLHQTDIAGLRHTFDVNTVGAVTVIKHFYPEMRKNAGAALITVTSEGCDIKSPGTWIPAYALSKCAATKISGIMNESARDVRFYSVHPGRIRTVMGRETWNIEPEEAACGMLDLLESGNIHRKGTWYMDYKGMDMMQP